MSLRSSTPPARAFAPATVSNIGCGFDLFGFAVEDLGDVVEACRTEGAAGVRITAIHGDGGALPTRSESNTAGIAALQVLKAAKMEDSSIELVVRKGMPLASGLGSSAASAVAAAVAVDAALEAGLSRQTLLACAVEGERASCGAAHGDNASPSLFGGFVMVRQTSQEGVNSLRVDSLPVPEGLSCALLHPHRAVDTGASRDLLGESIPLAKAVTQWGNTAALVAGLFRGDAELLASALRDVVAEPVRGPLQTGFAQVKAAALQAGALGSSLSGSGPTIFALCQDRDSAEAVAEAMETAFRATTKIECDRFVTTVGAGGARLLAPGEPLPWPT